MAALIKCLKHIFVRVPLRFVSILIVKFLQKRYKAISTKKSSRNLSQKINKLILIQSILYFFKEHFRAWGYFHPSCLWSAKDEKKFRKLFPQKDFEELDIVIWHNPEAVTYYHNKIYKLSKECPPIYEKDIKKQLIKWNDWN